MNVSLFATLVSLFDAFFECFHSCFVVCLVFTPIFSPILCSDIWVPFRSVAFAAAQKCNGLTRVSCLFGVPALSFVLAYKQHSLSNGMIIERYKAQCISRWDRL
jgi:hypothetical protein